jgi:hypothetical protein
MRRGSLIWATAVLSWAPLASADSLMLDLDRARNHSPPAIMPFVVVDLSAQRAGTVTAHISVPGLTDLHDESVQELVLNLHGPSPASGSRLTVSGPGVWTYVFSRQVPGLREHNDLWGLDVFFRPGSLASRHPQTFTITGRGPYAGLNAGSFDVSRPDKGNRFFAAALLDDDRERRDHHWVWADNDGPSVGAAAPFPAPLRAASVVLAGFAGFQFLRVRCRSDNHISRGSRRHL